MTNIAAVLRTVAPNANSAFVAASAGLPAVMAKHGFDTAEAQAMLISQTAHECVFRIFSEKPELQGGAADAGVAEAVSDPTDAQRCAGNLRALANAVYNGRMGNRAGSNDGWDFRGSGALQRKRRSAPTFSRRL